MRFLKRRGLRPLAQNFNCRHGELDLVMTTQHKELVFVEVRYRKGSDYGSAAETVTAAKQRRLKLAAQHYLLSHPELAQHSCRFDLVAIQGSRYAPSIEWLIAAFE